MEDGYQKGHIIYSSRVSAVYYMGSSIGITITTKSDIYSALLFFRYRLLFSLMSLNAAATNLLSKSSVAMSSSDAPTFFGYRWPTDRSMCVTSFSFSFFKIHNALQILYLSFRMSKLR